MEGIELSRRKRGNHSAGNSDGPSVSLASSSETSSMAAASSNWAEMAAIDEPKFIPHIPYKADKAKSSDLYRGDIDLEDRKAIDLDDYENNVGFDSRGDNNGYNSLKEDNFQNSSLSFGQLSPIDKKNFLSLVFLYLLQGIPVGLAFGSVPFLLKSRLSYGQVGIFTLASYPYSLKLLWSPIVDAFYNKSFGRRKSWIVPIQTISAIVLLILGTRVEQLMENAEANLGWITLAFFTLVFLCATQDIAVDGWALTLLTPEALSYASTAQTVGLNTGYFMSFTVFLAFNSPEFANKYLRAVPSDTPFITLNQYLTMWGWIYLVATIVVALFKTEERTRSDSGGIMQVYRSMYKVLKLYNIQILIGVHLVAKIGFQANEAVTNLKLLEKGFSKEDLALTVLIDFPFEIIFGYYAAKWSTGSRPLRPWMMAYMGRLAAAGISMLAVVAFPRSGKVGFGYLLVIILTHVLGSFMSTIQFVSINAFHTQIADPAIGGTYMTTLNTISNLGGQWPRLIVLYAVDWFTNATCVPKTGATDSSKLAARSVSQFGQFIKRAAETVGLATTGSSAAAANAASTTAAVAATSTAASAAATAVAEKSTSLAVSKSAEAVSKLPEIFEPFSCAKEAGKALCRDHNGVCNVATDGYYVANILCILIGLFLFLVWIQKKMLHLQSLPKSAWRIDTHSTSY